jgi:hypothetical protein
MSMPGNRENGGRSLSTAYLAAAQRRRPDVDCNEEPVLSEKRIPAATDQGNERVLGERVREGAGTRQQAGNAARSGEALEPLFTPEVTETYRSQWITIQSGFVDDPRQAVRSGDELVAQMMTNLADTFEQERHRVEAQLDSTAEGSTEELRVTLHRYRSFFERLLSL